MKKSNSLLGATLIVSALAILCKPLGFIREALIAAYYGATAETDVFFFAHSMPNAIFPAIGSGLALAFTSLYVKKMTEEGEKEGDHYASRMLLASVLVGIILSIIGVLISPVLVPLFAPGFSGGQHVLAVGLTRLTMGVFSLTILQYMLSAILNSKKRFASAQAAGLIYNGAIIAAIALFGKGQDMVFLMSTVIFGMFAQVAALYAACHKHFVYTHRLNPLHSDTQHLFWLAFPILLGNSVVQLNNIVDKALGSTLPSGSLSALTYANSLTAFVISIFITSLVTTLYPTLTTASVENKEQFGKTLLQCMGLLSLLLVPISCITWLDAAEIVSAVYARGSFDQVAVSYTALALAWYAPMFTFIGIREILGRAFFAIQDTKTPMRNSVIGVGCNIVFSLVFVRWLGLAGIALGTTISALVSASLLLWSARKGLPMLQTKPLFSSLGKQLLAGAVLVIGLAGFHQFVSLPWAIVQFAVDTAVGFVIYGLALLLLRSSELKAIIDLIKRNLLRSLNKNKGL